MPRDAANRNSPGLLMVVGRVRIGYLALLGYCF
jgi:hypothetical protein